MSQEQRCKQFLSDASQPRSSKSVKQMTTLRKFIHNNQEHRFPDSAKAQLFSTIERYLNMFDRSDSSTEATEQGEEDDDTQGKKVSALPLIEDALKVNIFTAKQKQKMLKWLEELQ